MSIKFTEESPDGILLIDKAEGKTSFEAVRMVRKILKCKKTGHAGTLDPFATGLLIILLGQGTKLSPFIMGGKKKYRAEIRLGIETDTCDSTGSVTNETPVRDLDVETIAEAVKGFTGVIDQTPPAYSALKVNGQRAYKLARKGIEFELKKREITVHAIDIVDVRLPLVTIDVSCSAGTYIRSLAVDIGQKLGTVAHLRNLRRFSSGLFNVEDAVSLEELDLCTCEALLKRVIPLHESLPDMEAVSLDNHLTEKLRNGYRPSWKEMTENIDLPDTLSGYVKLLADSNLVAVMEVDRASTHEKDWLKKLKVFN